MYKKSIITVRSKIKRLTLKRMLKVLGVFFPVLLTACAGQVPSDLGMLNGSELRPCPDKPNCIQTYDPADQAHFQLPLMFKVDAEQTRRSIDDAISKTGGKITGEKRLVPAGYYLHAEYESDWFRFVDDVEVVIKDGLIHVRSASRLGHSDMGANAKRFTAIKAIYAE
jgi:uncharacterized protein (DUF1499 family)